MVKKMTKRTNKLGLKKETISTLTSDSLARANGGVAVLSSARCAAVNSQQLPNGSDYTTILINLNELNGL